MEKQMTQTVMEKQKDTNYYEISRDIFWFTTSNTILIFEI